MYAWNILVYQDIFEDVSREFDEFRVNLIFASCVVGTCNILCGRVFSSWEGCCFVLKKKHKYICFVFSTVMVGVGMFTVCANFLARSSIMSFL